MKNLMRLLPLAVALLLLVPGTASANNPTYTSYRPASTTDCAAAHYFGYVPYGNAWYVRTTWGPITLRTYRTSPGSIYAPGTVATTLTTVVPTTRCVALLDYGCANLPNPNTWYYADSYVNQRGPGGLWYVTAYFHVKTNGYRVIETAPTTCEYFAVGVSISMNWCGMSILDTPYGTRYLFGARWTECYVHPIFGFCHTKGETVTLTTGAQISGRASW